MKVCPQCGNAFDDPTEDCPVDRLKLILLESSDADPMLGKLLDGRYRLIRKVGEGGMGSIYRAVHTEMSRTCAIKLLTALSPGKDDAIARFKREAKNSSRIDNVHAVTIYDFGQADDGMLFLAMEFIDGTALSRVLAEQRVLPIDRVIHLTNQIAEALAAAHSLGIVHRDLKPDNIMITHKGAETDFVKVLDFGIAKTIADEGGENLTKTGFVLGTPVYMSPEQLLGENLDGRSDIYSLAIIVYEMLSGRLPFDGDNPQAVMMKRVMSDPIRLRVAAPSLSEAIERAVMAGLRRDRDSRTPSVEAFAVELGRALYSGTQIMGGVVTSKLTEAGAARSTQGHVGYDTSADSGPSFTREAESSGGNVAAWAATEISFAPSRPIEKLPAAASFPEAAAVSVGTDNNAFVESEPRTRTGRSLWLGSAIAVVAIGIILYLLLFGGSAKGFAIVVKGAPPGSRIFINEDPRPRNAETVSDGLRVSGLDPGQVSVRVSHEGYADFVTTITGAKGEVQTCEAQFLAEIDYNGTMVPIPAGEFVMGDDNHEKDERPAHQVTLPAYYIDKYEVTNAQYKKFCDETKRPYPPNPAFDASYFTTKPDYPVFGVTIDDAMAYAGWAGKRLPTEGEWEKAASWDALAQKKRQYPWGDDFGSGHANIATDHPDPVSQPNGDRSSYGVFNMAGNVGEWVDAAYKPYKGNQTSNPDYDKDDRVMRGGTFFHASTQVESRTSYRNHLPRVFPKGFSAPVGIRCAVSATDPRIQGLLQPRSK